MNLKLTTCLCIPGFYADIHPLIDTVATSLGYQNKQYAVVIDAGSTGSRVLAYEFHKAVSRKSKFSFIIDGVLIAKRAAYQYIHV